MAKLGREARKRIGRAPKAKAIDAAVKILKHNQGFLLCNNKGLTVEQVTTLRAKMREGKVAVKMIKNTLLRIALERVGIDPKPLAGLLKEETVLFAGLEDPVAPAKLLMESLKGNEKLVLKGGFLDGKVLGPAEVEALSKLPNKQQLQAQLLGTILAPAQNLASVLNASVTQVLYALEARRKQLEGAA